MRKIYLLSVFIFIVTGCKGKSEIGDVFFLPYEDKEVITDAGLVIQFEDIDDNRCPRGGECDPDNADSSIVTLSISSGRRTKVAEVELPADSRGPDNERGVYTLYDGYAIRLMRVSPYPRDLKPIWKGDYIITARVDLDRTDLIDTEWQLEEIVEGDYVHLVQANLTAMFSLDGGLEGEGLCGRWSGYYRVKGDELKMGSQDGSKFCNEDAYQEGVYPWLVEESEKFEIAMHESPSFKIENDHLILSPTNDEIDYQLVFSKSE